MLKYKDPTIAVVDSGIGGISILRTLIDKFHAGNFIYVADNQYMPYGNKSKKMIKNRVEHIIDMLQTKYNVDIIVLACNTASSSIDKKPDNIITMKFETNDIYLATKLTKSNIKSDKVIVDHSLASQIEKYIMEPKILKSLIKQKVLKYKLNDLSSLVLGCTHYELVKDMFISLCPNTKIINNSDFIINNFDNISFSNNDINVGIILSKYSDKYYNKIIKLINR
ncbi:MAG: hypothetical protein IKC49_01030 [Clostridia bacterium]|nr:hypothetical protein [Clostridia bacterium]